MPHDRSWETGVDACWAAWKADPPNPLIAALTRCPHVFIRNQTSAVSYYTNPDPGAAQRWDLHYRSAAEHAPTSHSNLLRGYTSVLAVALAHGLWRRRGSNLADGVRDGLRDGIWWCLQLEQDGFSRFKPKESPSWEWLKGLFRKKRKDEFFGVVPVPDKGRGTWTVLREQIAQKAKPDPAGTPPLSEEAITLELGRKIVQKGIREAQKYLAFPVALFGHIKVVDRREFEEYWELQSSMRAYLRDARETKPLCLAVFGAPGSGKSSGVKQLGKMMPELGEPIEANVSQFTSVDDLAAVLHRSRDVALTGKVPLVLLDEFDAPWQQRPFGWLQYFLAPMQDGKFKHGANTYNVGRAVLVFIGGVNRSFDVMKGRMRQREFIDAKGPDFLSRLRRHLNVLGVDPVRERDTTHIIRRALLLRAFLEMYQKGIFRAMRDAQLAEAEARIDADVVDSFLRVSCYYHGVRSLEAVVATSRVGHGHNRFHWGVLPPREQLEMHLPVNEFLPR
jgi:hypothetical protein